MTYRCLSCGFAQDFDPADEAKVVKNHPWMKDEDMSNCPACHKYLNEYGGRKYGRIEMPDIKIAGVLQDESNPAVLAKRREMDTDFQELTARRGKGKLSAIRGRYTGSKKIFGFSVDELIEQHDRIEFRENPNSQIRKDWDLAHSPDITDIEAESLRNKYAKYGIDGMDIADVIAKQKLQNEKSEVETDQTQTLYPQ